LETITFENDDDELYALGGGGGDHNHKSSSARTDFDLRRYKQNRDDKVEHERNMHRRILERHEAQLASSSLQECQLREQMLSTTPNSHISHNTNNTNPPTPKRVWALDPSTVERQKKPRRTMRRIPRGRVIIIIVPIIIIIIIITGMNKFAAWKSCLLKGI
jgi:hypothetical protein